MIFVYRGCKVTILEWSGFYQARIVFIDGTSRLTPMLTTMSSVVVAAEKIIDEWSAQV